MSNQYAEVLRSYGVYWFSHWLVALLPVAIACVMAGSLLCHCGNPYAAFGIIAIVCFFGGFIWEHLRGQLASQFRWLFPEYLIPQLTIFISLASVVSIFWPTLLALRDGLPLLPVLATATGCFLACELIELYRLAAYIGWILLMLLPYGIESWLWRYGRQILGFFGGDSSLLATCLLAAFIAAIIFCIWKLTRITEESPPRYRRFQWSRWSNRPRMTGQLNTPWRQSEQVPFLSWLLRQNVSVSRPCGFLGRANRWRQITLGRRAVAIPLLISLTCIIVQGPPTDRQHLWPIYAAWLSFLPVMAIIIFWQKKWQSLPFEAMLPISRRSFLAELGTALAFDLFECWAYVLVWLIATEIIRRNPSEVERCAQFAGCQVLAFIFTYGSLVWAMRYRELGPAAVAFILVSFLGAPILLASLWWPGQSNDFAPVIGSFTLAIIGTFLIFDAYHRWLITEWG